MSATLVHRGPDSAGTTLEDGAGLAARRLAIIDLETGDQPIANEDGTLHVVQNGEIYNYPDLRRELEHAGHRFHTHGDTEVLVHAYEEWGDTFPRRLRGMFAIAIWDAPRRRLVLARDPYGIKPLYYRAASGEIAFASELRALPRGEIDLEALDCFLAFNFVPAPYSIFRATRKLEPGHVLVWERGETTVTRYAQLRPTAAPEVRREEEAELVEELRARLRDSVRAHLVSDVPVGVLLSGGVDSGALAALAAQESSEPLRTFSIGFEESSFSELGEARRVADLYGTRHRELVVRPNAALLLPALADAFDEPFADSSALPTYLVSQLAAQDVKVALSGEGGDELFGGYYTYVADLLAERAGGLARLARPVVDRLPSSDRRVPLEYKAKRFVRAAHLPPLERHHAWKEIFSDAARSELTGRAATTGPLAVLDMPYAAGEGAELLTRLQYVDFSVHLVDDLLTKTDRASMAHSLEARCPILDHRVVELAAAQPSERHANAGITKRLLREVVRPWVPAEVLQRPKRGFGVPLRSWFKGGLTAWARDILLDSRSRQRGWTQTQQVSALLEQHERGTRDHAKRIWALVSLELWARRHLDSVSSPARRCA